MTTLISGACGGLGKAFCIECLKKGEDLLISGRSEQRLNKLKDYLLSFYPKRTIDIYPADLTSEVERAAFFEFAKGYTFNRVINCAGADIQKGLDRYTHEKLVFQIRINFEAAADICLFALKHGENGLKIINVSSVSGIYPMPYFALYSAAKGALTSFSLALSEELKGKAYVLALLPGSIYTRDDVKEYIRSLGFWGKFAAKSPEYVAFKALKASDKGKRKYIPGFANKLMCALTRLVPQRLRLKYIARRWSKTEKDAF